jgi:hypothetical protein
MGVVYTRGWLKTHEKERENVKKEFWIRQFKFSKTALHSQTYLGVLKYPETPDSTAALCHILADSSD